MGSSNQEQPRATAASASFGVLELHGKEPSRIGDEGGKCLSKPHVAYGLQRWEPKEEGMMES